MAVAIPRRGRQASSGPGPCTICERSGTDDAAGQDDTRAARPRTQSSPFKLVSEVRPHWTRATTRSQSGGPIECFLVRSADGRLVSRRGDENWRRAVTELISACASVTCATLPGTSGRVTLPTLGPACTGEAGSPTT